MNYSQFEIGDTLSELSKHEKLKFSTTEFVGDNFRKTLE